jgi:hypothetical protein
VRESSVRSVPTPSASGSPMTATSGWSIVMVARSPVRGQQQPRRWRRRQGGDLLRIVSHDFDLHLMPLLPGPR